MIENWDGISADFLLRDRLVPIASRWLFDGRIPQNIEDILRYPLIHTGTRMTAWEDWLGVQGMIMPRPELVFSHMFMSISAAKDGLGIALVPDVLVDPRDRDLVALSSRRIDSDGNYYLLMHESNASHPAVLEFKAWLMAYARQTLTRLDDAVAA